MGIKHVETEGPLSLTPELAIQIKQQVLFRNTARSTLNFTLFEKVRCLGVVHTESK